jgi:hypothetical protein
VGGGGGGRGGRGAPKSVVQLAADMGDLTIFQLLMDDGAGGRQRTWSGTRGNTPLHNAALYNRLDIVKWCVENGCNVDTPGEQGCTVLHIAAKHGYGEMVAYLLDAGASTTAVSADQKTPAMMSKDEEIKDLFDFFQKMKAGGPPPPAHVQASGVQSGESGYSMTSSMGGLSLGAEHSSDRPVAGMARGSEETMARRADALAGGRGGVLGGAVEDEGFGALGGSRASRRAGKGGLGPRSAGGENFLSWPDDSQGAGAQGERGGGRKTGSAAGADKPEWLGGGNERKKGGNGGDGGMQDEDALSGGASRGRMKNSNT